MGYGVLEQGRGDVQKKSVESVVGQPLLDREPADRVHLVDRRDVDAVAVAQIREQHVVTLAEVVDAGSVQQEQVSLEPRRYLLVHRARIPYLLERLARRSARPSAPGSALRLVTGPH